MLCLLISGSIQSFAQHPKPVVNKVFFDVSRETGADAKKLIVRRDGELRYVLCKGYSVLKASWRPTTRLPLGEVSPRHGAINSHMIPPENQNASSP
jgi:hypothetical protein